MVLLELLALALATSQTQNSWPTVQQNEFKYFGNNKASKVIEMFKDDCHLFVESDASWIFKTRESLVMVLNPIQFELLLEKCQLNGNSQNEIPGIGGNYTVPNALNNTNIADMFLYNGINSTESGNTTEVAPIVFPGTKWCGRGDIASNYDDLGIYAQTDRCCRDHDNCPDNIPAGTVKHGLLNQASFTSSHCTCDEQFLNCLRSDNTLSQLTSSKIAYIYFNILKPLCFDERHPVKACQKKRLTGECIRPEYNFREGRQWQFFAAQPYFAKTVRGLFDKIGNILPHTEPTIPDPTSQSGRRSVAMPPGFTF